MKLPRGSLLPLYLLGAGLIWWAATAFSKTDAPSGNTFLLVSSLSAGEAEAITVSDVRRRWEPQFNRYYPNDPPVAIYTLSVPVPGVQTDESEYCGFTAFVYPDQVDMNLAALTLGEAVAKVREVFPGADRQPGLLDQGPGRLMLWVTREDPAATKGPGDGSSDWLAAVAKLGEHIKGTSLPDLRASVKGLFPFLPELGAYWLNSEGGINLSLAMLPESPSYEACERLRDTVLDQTVLGHILQEGYVAITQEKSDGSSAG